MISGSARLTLRLTRLQPRARTLGGALRAVGRGLLYFFETSHSRCRYLRSLMQCARNWVSSSQRSLSPTIDPSLGRLETSGTVQWCHPISVKTSFKHKTVKNTYLFWSPTHNEKII